MLYYNLGPGGKTQGGMAPEAVLRALATNLQRRAIDKGWNQSELARQASLHSGKRIGRDSISNYYRGRNMPSPGHLKAMAAALGCEITDLVPSGALPSVDRDRPPWRMEPTENGRVNIHVSAAVEFDTAQKILALLREEEEE